MKLTWHVHFGTIMGRAKFWKTADIIVLETWHTIVFFFVVGQTLVSSSSFPSRIRCSAHSTHPDSCLVDAEELAHQVSEINSLGCGVVENKLTPIESVLRIHQTHVLQLRRCQQYLILRTGCIGNFGQTKPACFFFVSFLIQNSSDLTSLGQSQDSFGSMKRRRSASSSMVLVWSMAPHVMKQFD
ncbi:hypothetical protein CLUG_04435 [Clavispora lusitaniae ATCC 42720]|uniref:Uncharacterized protein n=1 Tax=Clavispora lusitaniae (strain ATCC 42720) TaxID=306902 RepID=C4Y8A7_CLAL4|nr:uncharacterized protein CLUG_04435 [Clavispora lusitaniae ATCC 42720]EEQ40306.1 hypothetical protein CLUG_04435 [Clavispora lusitaniae ATCC 42720]